MKMKFYRYEWVEYASHDLNGEPCKPLFPNPRLNLITYDLIKETPKGYWIGYKDINYKKWIPKKSKKRYAYPTMEEAHKNFVERTKRRIEILEWTTKCCKRALELAEQKTVE